MAADNAQVGRQGGEMVVADLGFGAGDHREDGTFAHVGIAHQTHVSDGFQLQQEGVNLRFNTGLGKVRGLPGGGGEVGVTPAALAAAQKAAGFAGLVHVGHHAAGGFVPHHSAHGHLDGQAFAALAGAAARRAVLPVFGGVFALEAEIQQGVHVGVGIKQHIAAVAAVAAVGPAVEDELLPVEGHAAVAAVAGLSRNFHMIHKIAHGMPPVLVNALGFGRHSLVCP